MNNLSLNDGVSDGAESLTEQEVKDHAQVFLLKFLGYPPFDTCWGLEDAKFGLKKDEHGDEHVVIKGLSVYQLNQEMFDYLRNRPGISIVLDGSDGRGMPSNTFRVCVPVNFFENLSGCR